MNDKKDAVLRDAQRFLKRTKLYQEERNPDCQVVYIMFVPDRNTYIAYADNGYGDVYTFDLYGTQEPMLKMDHNFTQDLFDDLQNGWKLTHMSMDCHGCVWADITEQVECGAPLTSGMQKYLDYCKHHGITLAKLQNGSDWPSYNIMQHYDKSLASMPRHKDRER